jgi:hydrogenase 3 maturation protease
MDLREQLAGRIQGKVVVMGIGNPCRGDDAAGSLVVRQIREAPGVCVVDAQEVPEHYGGQVASHRPDTILLVDCVRLDSAPGSVAVLEKDQMADHWPSTHCMPISVLMDYLERETRARILLIAIQPCQTEFLQPVSPEVHASIAGVARVLNSVFAMRREPAAAATASRTKGVTC